MSDLLNLIQQKETNERALVETLKVISRWLIPTLLGKLSGKIDREVICAEGKELVMPLIREVISEEFRRIPSAFDKNISDGQAVEIMAEATWVVLTERRNGTLIEPERSRFQRYLSQLSSGP